MSTSEAIDSQETKSNGLKKDKDGSLNKSFSLSHSRRTMYLDDGPDMFFVT